MRSRAGAAKLRQEQPGSREESAGLGADTLLPLFGSRPRCFRSVSCARDARQAVWCMPVAVLALLFASGSARGQTPSKLASNTGQATDS